VSTVSSISGAKLAAARPPKMSLHGSWVDVFKELRDTVIFNLNFELNLKIK
jgi:hypothetical protein